MGRKAMLYFIAVAVILTVTFVFVFFAEGEDNSDNIEFLESYGWKVEEKSIEEEEVIIPEEFDDVYENYNALQLRAGLDLRPYKGMKGKRYTYVVKNYPHETDGEVRANVICIDGKRVAGDIMTVNINGFMHSLMYDDAQQ